MKNSDDGNTSIISFMTILFIVFAVCSVSVATAFFVEDGDNLQVIINNAGNSDDVIVESGSGGSGGGGGGNSGEAFENILISDTKRKYVNNGLDVSYRFDLDENIVRYINFTGLKNSGEISAKVEILRGVSNVVDQSPQDTVYKHFNIWVGNFGWSSPSNIADPTIEFRVARTWISQNNVDISTIRLNRYSVGNWESLETHRLDGDSEYYHFKAKTPDFSHFAVTGKDKYSLTEVANGSDAVVGMYSVPKVNDIDNQKTNEETQASPGFGLIAGLAALVIATIRKNQH